MKYEKLTSLPKIFRNIENEDGIIEYSCKNLEDHKILESLGYTIEGDKDCCYFVKGLPGLNLSGKNTNGVFLYSYANKATIEAFLNIVSHNGVKFVNYSTYKENSRIFVDYKNKNTNSLF